MLALLHCLILGLLAPQQKLASYLFISAKPTVAQAWKTPMDAFQGVKDRLTDMMVNKLMSSILKDSHLKFLKV